MAKRLSYSQVVYDRVTEAGPLRELRGFPQELQSRFRSQLEGIRLPSSSSSRKAFLANLEPLAHDTVRRSLARYLQLHSLYTPQERLIPWICSLEQTAVCSIEEKFAALKESAGLALASPRPGRYMRFLNDHVPVLSDQLKETLSFFTSGRKLVFVPISEEARQKQARIRELQSSASDGSLEETVSMIRAAYAASVSEDIASSEVESELSNFYLLAGLMFSDFERALRIFRSRAPDSYAVWEGEEASTEKGIAYFKSAALEYLAHKDVLALLGFFATPVGLKEYKSSFSCGWLKGYVVDEEDPTLRQSNAAGRAFLSQSLMIVGSESEPLVQHEMQHLFDSLFLFGSSRPDVRMEYTANLSELLFSSDTSPMEWRRDLGEQVVLSSMGFQVSRPHLQAAKKLREELPNDLPDEMTMIKARELFNNAYRKLCGFTYDEILQPFTKS